MLLLPTIPTRRSKIIPTNTVYKHVALPDIDKYVKCLIRKFARQYPGSHYCRIEFEDLAQTIHMVLAGKQFDSSRSGVTTFVYLVIRSYLITLQKSTSRKLAQTLALSSVHLDATYMQSRHDLWDQPSNPE